MCRTSTSLVLLKSGILSISEVISHAMLLLWLRILWPVVVLTTVIPCLGASLLLIFVNCNVFKLVLLESPPSTHTSLLIERPFIGCTLNIVLDLKLSYWCARFYKVVIKSNLNLSLNLDIVYTVDLKGKLVVCCLKFDTLQLQYIGPLSILAYKLCL